MWLQTAGGGLFKGTHEFSITEGTPGVRAFADGDDIGWTLTGSKILPPACTGPTLGPQFRVEARVRVRDAAVGGGA